MLLTVKACLTYSAPQPCDALLQIEPATDAVQRCDAPRLLLLSGTSQSVLAGHDGIGQRRWVSVGRQLDCLFEAQIDLTRAAVDLSQLQETPRPQLPAEVLPYLMPSRYCQSDLFLDFTAAQFGGLSGGALAQTMADWVFSNFTYDIFASDPATTAVESFGSQRGVCRDYAHVLITFLRAADLPARFVSAYAPGVTPQDFHAVVEVYLDGAWHLLDPTGMADPTQIVRICVGRDAADASFLTSYGALSLQDQSVDVQRV